MLLIETALDQYYREHIAVKAVARRRAEHAMANLETFFAGTPVVDIDIPLCREYRRHRSGVSGSTVRRELGVLQAAVNHAIAWRRLKGVSAECMPSIELPPENTRRPSWLFKSELNTLMEVAAEHDRRVYRFVQIAYHTAGRKASIEQLRWEQVDLGNRRIDLRTPGKTETKKRQPIVPISENMAAELEALKAKALSPYVLVTNANIRPAFDRIANLGKLATLLPIGLREEGTLCPHMLRHSRATHLLQDGKNPYAVAQLLGDNLETVLKVYGHCCESYLAEVLL